MTDAWYPTEISDRETELGFELVEICVGTHSCFDSLYSGWIFVVAKILGESDIVVKMNFGDGSSYIHKRFGKYDYDKFET